MYICMEFDPMDDTRMLVNLLTASSSFFLFLFFHIIMNLKDNLKWYFWVFSNFNTPRV